MALQDVLSAMRSIILDPLEIPAALEARTGYYRSQFPALSDAELEDLAKIEPSKFSIYTQSIFTAERGILRNHFPMTYRLLTDAWEKTHGEPLNGFELMRRMHVKRPWKSATTHSLATNFHAYLSEDLPEISEIAPEISEVARFELLCLEIKRHLDEAEAALPRLTKADLSGATVESLMEASFAVSTSSRFFASDRDVVETYVRFRAEGEYEAPIAEPLRALGSRSAFNHIRWQKLEPGVYDFLSAVPPGEPRAVSDLAESLVLSMSQDQPEEALFLGFLERLMALIDTGAIVIPKSV